MDKSELEALLARIDVWLLVFGIVVVVGVAGESFFGIRHWWNSRKLQALQNAENVAQRAEIAKASDQAAAAGERTAKLELEVAQQREKAAKAEHDLLELQQRVKPRRFTAEQRKLLVDALIHSPNKGGITIDSVLGDGEGHSFALQIDGILKEAGWPTSGVNQNAYGDGGNPIGLFVLVHSAATAPSYAVALREAFKAAGIPLPGFENANTPEGTVSIVVGNKPQ